MNPAVLELECGECDEVVGAKRTGHVDAGYAEYTCPQCGETLWNPEYE